MTICVYQQLNSRYFVKAFPTIHRISSQGYIVYREEKTLKQEYRGKEGFEVAALHRKGVDIHDLKVVPEIAYCGKYCQLSFIHLAL